MMWIFLLADLLSVHRYINGSLGKGSKVSLLVDLRMRMRTSKKQRLLVDDLSMRLNWRTAT